jgi:hypothetical protein
MYQYIRHLEHRKAILTKLQLVSRTFLFQDYFIFDYFILIFLRFRYFDFFLLFAEGHFHLLPFSSVMMLAIAPYRTHSLPPPRRHVPLRLQYHCLRY